MPTGYSMQIVAHPDDDLFFINPDLQAAAGLSTVTVYVTAGQITGNGTTDGQRARNRQLGAMAAHAQIAGVVSPQWSGSALWAGRRQVERYTLTNAATPVDVVFCNLPDGGLGAVDSGQTKTTVLTDGGPVTRTYSYTRTDVVAVLAALMCRYQPTALRALDAIPDTRYMADHADHIAAAKMAADAAAAYSDSLLCVPHRGYGINDVPVNLDPDTRAAKRTTANAYLAYDSAAGTFGWLDRTYLRWPRGSSWIGRNADGRLHLSVVRSGIAWMWWQTTTGGWAGPAPLDPSVGALAPAISIAPNADGRMQLVARRLSDHHIVTVAQSTINGGWGSWFDFGSPNAGAANAGQVGAPAVARLGDGRLRIYLKNGGGGVSMLPQTATNGGWASTWTDLGGSDVQDGLAAAVNPAGCVELVAATRTGILHWYQDTVGGPHLLNAAFPATVPASPPAAVLTQDGTVTVAYRAAGTAEVVVNSQTTPAAGWASALTVPGRPGSVGPALVAPPGIGRQPMLVSRTADGHIAVGVPQAGSWAWTDLDGGPVIDTPAVAVDASGAVVLAAVGMNGAVQVCTQVAAGPTQPFGPWLALPV